MQIIRIAAFWTVVFATVAAPGCGRRDSWTTESGLRITELFEGQGDTPEAGDVVSFEFTAWLVDGDEFDSTARLGEPMRCIIGRGQLLPGLEEGLATMRPGGKRILVLPPELAYGKGGRPPLVPPDRWIRVEIELVEVETGPPPIAPWSVAGREVHTVSNGFQYVDFEVGRGEFPAPGGKVVVHYAGFLGDGTLFDSSYYKGTPLEFKVSTEHVIPGWVQGLLTMREGGKRKLIIPPSLGYGEKGFGKTIPPGATLIYDIELIEVRP